jgi:hypothetical protein
VSAVISTGKKDKSFCVPWNVHKTSWQLFV